MARYEKHDGDEAGKFWEITRKGAVISTRTGKIGAGATRDRDGQLYLYDRPGRTTDREFADAAAAQREYDKLVAAKQKDGFALVGAADAAPTAIEMHRNAALETTIVSAPDDDAAYLVYADWLIAQDDPRGELISLQHAMRGQQDPAKFMTYKKQEEALRASHLPSWLGDVAGTALHRLKLDWRLGFLHAIRVDGPEHASEASMRDVVAAVLASPLAIVLRELALRGNSPDVTAGIPETLPPLVKKVRFVICDVDSALNVTANAAAREQIGRQRTHLRELGITTELDHDAQPNRRFVPMRE